MRDSGDGRVWGTGGTGDGGLERQWDGRDKGTGQSGGTVETVGLEG